MRRRVFALGKEIQRVLVLVAMVAMKACAQLGQRPFNKRTLQHQPRKPYIPRGLKIDLIKSRREIVRVIPRPKLAERLCESYCRLFVRSKPRHGIA